MFVIQTNLDKELILNRTDCMIIKNIKLFCYFMKAARLAFLFLIAQCVLIIAYADELPLQAGDYIHQGGDGYLSLKSTKKNEFDFFIHTDGANGHVCELDGKIQNDEASMRGDEDKPCSVSFRAHQNGVDVTANQACRYYCGARAGFWGLYLVPARGCVAKEVKETRSQFKRLYERKSYQKAEATFISLLSNCALTLNYLDSAWIRNDLAVTQYHLNNLNACRNTLEPLAEYAISFIGQDVFTVQPDDMPYLPVMKATLSNLKLCGDARVGSLKQ